jgi:hypothetical protein
MHTSIYMCTSVYTHLWKVAFINVHIQKFLDFVNAHFVYAQRQLLYMRSYIYAHS